MSASANPPTHLEEVIAERDQALAAVAAMEKRLSEAHSTRSPAQVKVYLDQLLAAHAHFLRERFRGAEIEKVRAAEDRFDVTLDWAIEKLREVRTDR